MYNSTILIRYKIYISHYNIYFKNQEYIYKMIIDGNMYWHIIKNIFVNKLSRLDIRKPIILSYNIFIYWNVRNNYQTSRLMITFAHPFEFIAYSNHSFQIIIKTNVDRSGQLFLKTKRFVFWLKSKNLNDSKYSVFELNCEMIPRYNKHSCDICLF